MDATHFSIKISKDNAKHFILQNSNTQKILPFTLFQLFGVWKHTYFKAYS
jgi:hypothetical protein